MYTHLLGIPNHRRIHYQTRNSNFRSSHEVPIQIEIPAISSHVIIQFSKHPQLADVALGMVLKKNYFMPTNDNQWDVALGMVLKKNYFMPTNDNQWNMVNKSNTFRYLLWQTKNIWDFPWWYPSGWLEPNIQKCRTLMGFQQQTVQDMRSVHLPNAKTVPEGSAQC